eukprot:scaffold36057_cov31-Phaeocystis_antarctica.AAC.1
MSVSVHLYPPRPPCFAASSLQRRAASASIRATSGELSRTRGPLLCAERVVGDAHAVGLLAGSQLYTVRARVGVRVKG